MRVARCARFLGAVLLALLGLTSGREVAAQSREVRVVNVTGAVPGQNVTVPIEIVAQGNEAAIGFTVTFNPAVLGNPTVAVGNGAANATLFVNTNEASVGLLGITLAMPIGQTLQAGVRRLVTITFGVSSTALAGTTPIGFGDQLVKREVSDANANALQATFTAGTVAIVQPNPSPTLTSITPATVSAGGNAFTLTVTGTNFLNSSVVRLNGSARPTTFASATQLTSQIPASDVVQAGTPAITVQTPGPGGGISGEVVLTINNPVPTIASISPNSVTIGSSGVTITVNGTNFVTTSKVRFNDQERPTIYVSSTQLTAQIPASDLTRLGAAGITVLNPLPAGGTSNQTPFTVGNPVPVIASFEPASIVVTTQPFVLTVNGSNFVQDSSVRWNTDDLVTTFVSPTRLTVRITENYTGTIGVVPVRVFSPEPGGGGSNTLNFEVGYPKPTIASITPTSAIATSSLAQVVIKGSGYFINKTESQFNGKSLPNAWNSSEQLTVNLRAAELGTPGTAPIVIVNPTPGGGASNTVNFTIHPVPTAQISFNPPNPKPNENVTINLSGTWPTGCVPLLPNITVVGNEIRVATSNGSEVCTQAATNWSLSAQQSFPLGSYTVRVTYRDVLDNQFTIGQASLTVGNLASVSAASFLGEQIAPESIVAAFGTELATRVEVANTTPLPTELAGTKISVRDGAGMQRLAPLFFVAPAQINYQMPPDTANGAATVTVTSGDNKTSVGVVQVARVAPGLFTANANGQGVVAATLLRVKPNGDQIFEPVARFDSGQNRFVSIPIDLGPAEDQVFLIASGSGFRFNTALSAVNAKIGGIDAPALYAGLTPGLIGLDQVNLRLPQSLAGRGEVDLVLTVDGKVANTVKVNFR